MPAIKRGKWVYFLQSLAGGPIKIGCSATDPEQRLRGLQIGSATPFVCIGLTWGEEDLERKLHRRFDKERIRGEWFRPTPELLKYIESLGEGTKAASAVPAPSSEPAPAAPAPAAPAELKSTPLTGFDPMLATAALPDFIGVDEVADVLRISRGHAYACVRDGRIHSFRLGRRIFVPKTALLHFLNSLDLVESSEEY